MTTYEERRDAAARALFQRWYDLDPEPDDPDWPMVAANADRALSAAGLPALIEENERLRAERDGVGDVAEGTLWRAQRDLATLRNEMTTREALRREALIRVEELEGEIDRHGEQTIEWHRAVETERTRALKAEAERDAEKARAEAAEREMHARELHHFEEEQRSAELRAHVDRLEAAIRGALDVCRPGGSVPLGVSEARHWDRLLAETHRILAGALTHQSTERENR